MPTVGRPSIRTDCRSLHGGQLLPNAGRFLGNRYRHAGFKLTTSALGATNGTLRL